MFVYPVCRFSQLGHQFPKHIQMNKGSEFRQGLSVAFRLGIELTVAIVIGALMGYALDSYFNSKPWFLAIGVILGGIAGCLNVYRVAKEMTLESDKDQNNGV
jgi:F0F1-type ATP synthase assembly protein I